MKRISKTEDKPCGIIQEKTEEVPRKAVQKKLTMRPLFKQVEEDPRTLNLEIDKEFEAERISMKGVTRRSSQEKVIGTVINVVTTPKVGNKYEANPYYPNTTRHKRLRVRKK